MIKWFENLNDSNKIAIFGIAVTVISLVIGGFYKLFTKNDLSTSQKTFQQDGVANTAISVEENKGNIAGVINSGIDGDDALKHLISVSTEKGQLQNENKHLEEENEKQKNKIIYLEELLVQKYATIDSGSQQMQLPSKEAKEQAKLINENDGTYALALKAIAEGNPEKADSLLDEEQRSLDNLQQGKDKAQTKIYLARIQNYSYAGRFQYASQYCDKLLPLSGEDTNILNVIAITYYRNSDYPKAESLMNRVLAINKSSLGEDNPEVAKNLNNLAMLYLETNRLSDAEPLLKRALAINEAYSGKDDPVVAKNLNNLAMLYKETKRFFDAEQFYNRALMINEASLGKDHPEVANVLNNLAMLYLETNRFYGAEPLLKRALMIFEASFGKDHPDLAKALYNLATLYQDTNRLSDAEPLLKRALVILEKSLGSNHPNTIMVRKRYNNCLTKLREK